MKPGKEHTESKLNELLQEHFLKGDAVDPGVSESFAEQVLNSTPKAEIAADRKAEMLSRLKKELPSGQTSGGNAAGSGSKGFIKPLFYFTAAAAAVTAILFVIFTNDPLNEDKSSSDYNMSMLQSEEVPAPEITEAPPADSLNPDATVIDADNLPDNNLSSGLSTGSGSSGISDADGYISMAETDEMANNEPLPVEQDLLTKEPAPVLSEDFAEAEEALPAYEQSGNYYNSAATPTSVNKKSEKQKASVNGAKPGALNTFFTGNIHPSRTITANTAVETSIQGPSGTYILIPRNAFVYADGTPVDGQVQVQLTEIFDLAGYVMGGLGTTADGRNLSSGGMINISASAGGKQLQLANGKQIYVEFPQETADADRMQLFRGEGSPGNMNWNPVQDARTIIPLPVMQMDFGKYADAPKTKKEWNDIVRGLNSPAYAFSWIASREFIDRLNTARQFDWNTDILKIYIKNQKKPLWEVDRMVADQVKADYKNDQYSLDPSGLEKFEAFASQKLAQPVPFKDYGLNLDHPKAYEELLSKGISRTEADNIMQVHQARKKILTDLSKQEPGLVQKMNAQQSARVPGTFSASGFAVSWTGWTNLNLYLPGSNNAPDLVVKVDGQQDAELSGFLVYPATRTVIQAEAKGKDKLQFNAVIPQQKGHLFIIAADGKQTYFRNEDVKLSGNETRTLKVSPATKADIKKAADLLP